MIVIISHTSRAYHCSVYFEEKVYVIGGATVDDRELSTGIILMDWGWEPIQPMISRRKGLTCSVFRGRIWACGGDAGSKLRNDYKKLNSCESYHPNVRSKNHILSRYTIIAPTHTDQLNTNFNDQLRNEFIIVSSDFDINGRGDQSLAIWFRPAELMLPLLCHFSDQIKSHFASTCSVTLTWPCPNVSYAHFRNYLISKSSKVNIPYVTIYSTHSFLNEVILTNQQRLKMKNNQET